MWNGRHDIDISSVNWPEGSVEAAQMGIPQVSVRVIIVRVI
jgi:hypothetical protein